MKNILRNIRFLFMPSFWLVEGRYSKAWDIKLNELLNLYSFKNNDGYQAMLGKYKLRVANHPYASFEYKGFRPSRLTLLKAGKKLKMELELNLKSKQEKQAMFVNEKGVLKTPIS